MSKNKTIFVSRESMRLRSIVRAKAINDALEEHRKSNSKELRNSKDNITKFEKKKDFSVLIYIDANQDAHFVDTVKKWA